MTEEMMAVDWRGPLHIWVNVWSFGVLQSEGKGNVKHAIPVEGLTAKRPGLALSPVLISRVWDCFLVAELDIIYELSGRTYTLCRTVTVCWKC